MASQEPQESGSLLMAILLLLGLGFAGAWILASVEPGGDPTATALWFLLGAGVILVVGLAWILRRGRRSDDDGS